MLLQPFFVSMAARTRPLPFTESDRSLPAALTTESFSLGGADAASAAETACAAIHSRSPVVDVDPLRFPAEVLPVVFLDLLDRQRSILDQSPVLDLAIESDESDSLGFKSRFDPESYEPEDGPVGSVFVPDGLQGTFLPSMRMFCALIVFAQDSHGERADSSWQN
jgi:hypothetical protein